MPCPIFESDEPGERIAVRVAAGMPTFTAADGAELSYTDSGPRGGIPLLFLHGWIATASIWTPVISLLAKRHRTVAIDMRGFGESSAARGPYRVETFADDLSALIADLDLDPSVVIGHSMGAAVAQRFAIDRPEAVEGLVLIAPVPVDGVAFPPKIDALFRSIPGNPDIANAWLAQLTHHPQPPAITALLRAGAAAAAAPAALESYESWSNLSFADEAATIETPTLVIAAAGDKPFTPDFVNKRTVALIEGSRLEIVDEAAHYVPLERPDRIAKFIERFIDQL